jgi:hypothetical protein
MMASKPPGSARLALLAAILLAPAAARAQTPNASERETARSLMNEGRDKRDHNDLRSALASFKAADAIMHVPTTGFEVARTQVALGLLVEARDTLHQVLRWSPRPGDPKPFADARASAQTLDDDLAGRIPSLHVSLSNRPEDPHLTVDGVEIPAEAASAPIRLDPGHHVITAGAKGTARAEVDLAERDTKTVSLALPAEPAESKAAPAANADSESATHESSHTAGTIALASFGVGAVGLAVGAVTGIMSIQKTNQLKSACAGNTCPSSSAGDLDAAHSTATISTAAFIVAGAGVAVGVGALLFGNRHSPDATAAPQTGLRVTPWVGLGSAGLRGSF